MYLARESAALASTATGELAVQRAKQAAEVARKVSELHGDRYAVDEGQIHLHLGHLLAVRGENRIAEQSLHEAIACFTRTARAANQAAESLDEARNLASSLGE